MKVFIATMPFTGHINPMQAIARELIKRGHEVVWMTGKDFESKVAITGAHFRPTMASAAADVGPLGPDPGSSGLAAAISILRRLFLDRIPAQVEDYQAVLADFHADILLVDLTAFGAHALRDLKGIPYATLGINPLVTQDPEIPPWGSGKQPPTTTIGRWTNCLVHKAANLIFYPKLTTLLNQQRRKVGLDPLPPRVGFYETARSDSLHIMPTTPVFEFPRKNLHPAIKFVGPLLPVVDDSSWIRPSWWDELLAHPRDSVVHITQGTYATNAANLIKPALAALASCSELLVIVTSPDADTTLQDLPANARAENFIPHAALLPHVGVFVTNAGYNGVLAALAHGVPLVCAGRTEDKADVSSRVTWSEAGLDLGTDKPSEQALRNAVLRVVSNKSFKAAAQAVAADFATHDGPAEAVAELERVVQGHAGDGP
jgi:UDP:flavonoid glycosyltransferase YjiC (YdhE family)